jgi:hypothetical protein
MEKTDAINLLGGTPKKAALAMGYKTVQAIYMWPETLPQSIADQVNGALVRIKAQRKANRMLPSALNKVIV